MQTKAVVLIWCTMLTRAAPVLAFVLMPGTAFCVEDDGQSKGPKEVLTIKAGAGYITFSPDSRRLAGKVSGKIWRATDVMIWEVASGKEVMTLTGHTGGIWQLSFSPNGKRLASNDNYSVKVWDLATRKEIRSFNTPAFTRSIVFAGDGKLATGHDDGRIRLWDAETSRLVRTIKAHTDEVSCVAFSPDGLRLATASHDKTIKLWDVQSFARER